MIRHYLKVAFRNLWKYKSQTLVSVIGLATGFACFAMATLWVRYEMTYDSFHKKADRIYFVYSLDPYLPNNILPPSYLAEYLKSTFPEIANAVVIGRSHIVNFEYEGIAHKADVINIDSSFFSMFDVKIVEGSIEFPIFPPFDEFLIAFDSISQKKDTKIAITREKALQLFGNGSPVGKKIEVGRHGNYYEICAVVTGLSKQSNFPFDFLIANRKHIWENWLLCSGRIFVELVRGIDMKAFEKKLDELEIPQAAEIKNIKLIPITSLRNMDPTIIREVQFQHTVIFAVAGLLLILCTLFNCLTLFVSRFRMRQRELALRTVYGASGWSLFTMLSVEFLMSMIAALIPGAVLIEILRPFFLKVSGIQLELSAIYLESGIYVTGVIALALTVFFVSLVIFRRRTLDANIRSNKKIFRKTSIVVQLMVSIVFAFCTLIILKQMYHLHNSADLGFSFKNRSTITVSKPYEYGEYEYGEQKMSLTISTVSLVLNDKIKQIPEIKETFIGYHPLLPAWDWGTRRIIDWDGKQRDAKELPLLAVGLPEEYAKFYDLKLIEGEFLKNEDDEKYVMIDESAAKAFGWNKAAGKSFWEGTSVSDNSKKKEWVVKGVIKNIYKFSPTSAPMPSLFRQPFTKVNNLLSFKYDEGKRKICMEKINKIIEKEFPNMSSSNISYSYLHMEEEYDRYLKSENILLAILTVVSIVCVIVCVFGFVSMVSLTCEERRKEIAIRKINGATIKDILDIFFKEYLTLLVIGALIAFPVGYIIMKPWLEQYVIQTPISAWVYLSILLALIMVIVMCVGRRVYKTSRENPINAINR